MDIRTFTGGGFGENAYLAICPTTGACVAVDPGAASEELVRSVQSGGLSLEAILLTHAHLDHIEGVHVVRAHDPSLPIWLHPDDLGMYHRGPQSATMFGMVMEPQPEPTDRFAHGQRFEFGETGLDVRFTPGHAPGHVILVAESDGLAIVGDVVFQGSIGRTDLPGGDMPTLMRSILGEVMTLPDETVLYPGHGPPTTVGQERVANPFIAPLVGRGRA